MREIRPSGSEGGGTKPIVSSYPYIRRRSRGCRATSGGEAGACRPHQAAKPAVAAPHQAAKPQRRPNRFFVQNPSSGSSRTMVGDNNEVLTVSGRTPAMFRRMRYKPERAHR
jgi:hypothetical protein